VQVGAGFSGPVSDWSDEASGALAWTAMVGVAYRPSLQLSLEYARMGFGCTGVIQCDASFEKWKAQSVRAQLEYRFPIYNGVVPWVRGGVSTNFVDFKSRPSVEAGTSVGFLAGGGFEIPLSNAGSVVLGGRGERFGVDLPRGGDAHATFWVVEFAFRLRVR
jgi:opacity protein-like surface antigen